VGIATAIPAAADDRAHDQPEAVTLRYDAPPGCPDRGVVVAAILERTPLARFVARAERTFAITIETTPDGFSGTLVVDTAEPRGLTAHRCDDLVSALALITALAIDPTATTAARPTPISHPRWRGGGAVAAMIDAGVSPDVMPGGSFAGRLSRGRLALGLGALVGYDRTRLDIGRATFWWFATRAASCVTSTAIGLELAGCGHVEIGAVHAAGEDIAMGRSVTRLWLAAGLHARVAWPADSSSFVELELGGSVPFERDRYLFQPNTTIHETADVTGWICVGVGKRFQ
jgi:hypothetical protein